jgi:hypothetical protein
MAPTAVTGAAVVWITDGLAAAAAALAVLAVAALAVARYAAGADAQDSGYRRSVRLLRAREPAVGEWQRLVRASLGPEGYVHFPAALRPQLQRLFAARLAERHGVALHRSPRQARELIGADLWPWIDPAGRAPQPAPTEAVLHALLDRLEAL